MAHHRGLVITLVVAVVVAAVGIGVLALATNDADESVQDDVVAGYKGFTESVGGDLPTPAYCHLTFENGSNDRRVQLQVLEVGYDVATSTGGSRPKFFDPDLERLRTGTYRVGAPGDPAARDVVRVRIENSQARPFEHCRIRLRGVFVFDGQPRDNLSWDLIVDSDPRGKNTVGVRCAGRDAPLTDRNAAENFFCVGEINESGQPAVAKVKIGIIFRRP